MTRFSQFSKQGAESARRKHGIWWTLLMSLFVLNLASPALAHDAEHKRVISKWRSDGLIFSLSKDSNLYQGAMTGTFIVQDNTMAGHYMHSAQMTCPFSVQINNDGPGKLQGVCRLTNEKGDTATADIFCKGSKDECTGLWSFTSGTGKLEGIRGGGTMTIRVDLVNEELLNAKPGFPAQGMKASGYLKINELIDNVVDKDRFPEVR